MNFLKNQKGVSLVESLVAISLTAAAGVAYMTHTQTVAKNEARQKVRSSIEILNAQALDYLKSRDICNENISKAFASVPLIGTEVSGDTDYRALKNKGFKDAAGNMQSKNIFAVGDIFDGGRILISDVSYKVSELVDVTQPSSPWTKSGKIKVSVEMESCKDGGPVVFKGASGVLQERCPVIMRNKSIKTFDKFVAFKTNSSNVIVDSPIREKKINPATGQFEWMVVGSKKNLACADSQDALVEAANSYTDLKVCLQELKTMLFTRTSGTTECGLSVTNTPKVDTTVTSTLNLKLPQYVYSEDENITMIGGGSRGGFGGADGRGLAGRASILKRASFESMGKHFPSGNCAVAAGAGGRDGSDNGSDSFIICGSLELRSLGGKAPQGRAGGSSNVGEAGENSMDGVSVLGSGGHGRGKSDSNDGTSGVLGAGGGGGANCNNCSSWRKRGTDGGSGFVRLKYQGFTVEDPENVFASMGTTVNEFLLTAPGVVVTKK
jgi:hypothetical protein